MAAHQGSPKRCDKAGLPKPSQCTGSNRAKMEFLGGKDTTRDRRTIPAGGLSTGSNPTAELTSSRAHILSLYQPLRGFPSSFISPAPSLPPLHQQLTPSLQHLNSQVLMKEMLREQGLLALICSPLQQPWCTMTSFEGGNKAKMRRGGGELQPWEGCGQLEQRLGDAAEMGPVGSGAAQQDGPIPGLVLVGPQPTPSTETAPKPLHHCSWFDAAALT